MKEYLSITEMASLHQISRQTLIYYDRIGLFSPACTGENRVPLLPVLLRFRF